MSLFSFPQSSGGYGDLANNNNACGWIPNNENDQEFLDLTYEQEHFFTELEVKGSYSKCGVFSSNTHFYATKLRLQYKTDTGVVVDYQVCL